MGTWHLGSPHRFISRIDTLHVLRWIAGGGSEWRSITATAGECRT
jgi:hypothetical protein